MIKLFYKSCLLAGLTAASSGWLGAQQLAHKNVFQDPLDVPALMHQSVNGRPLMSIAVAGRRLVAVGMRGLIVLSDDSGKTWKQALVPVESDLLSVSFPSATEGWAVGHDGVVLHTDDGGNTWSKQFDGREAATTLVAQYKARIAAGDVALQSYLDQLILNFKSGPSLPYLGVWFKDAQHGLAVGAFGMAIATENGGKTWQPMLDRIDNPEFLHLNAVLEIGGDVYIAAEKGTIFKLNRRTGRFSAMTTGYGGSFFGITGNAGVLLAYGLRGTIYRSADHGMTWSPMVTPLHATITSAAYLPHQQAVVLVTTAGDIAVIDTSGQKSRPLAPERNMVFTGVQALGDTTFVVAGLGGISTLAQR